ncbi:MAG: tRNA (adenosine(37)-N6)-dimethylallyltransferase MiaA [Lachnospiraceae bacterium]|nr:tRNA (adenosine(37)-N6)-dimethylallyltransferase MiaA [Lachnospiraceae bacterium]
MKKRLIILTGPTGAGKTKISIELAKALNGEIISADSMQVYKGLDIGSAKITDEEMQGVRHFLIDVLDPQDAFDVTVFQKMAKEAIDDITSRGKLPIVVGGTGFYIQALRRDVDFTEEDGDTKLRKSLEEEAERIGKEAFHEKLKEIDPASYERIPAGNVKRVVRALEFYQIHGYPISEHNDAEKEKTSIYDDFCFVLCNERSVLYDAINKRVDKMVGDGLIEEVRALKEAGLTMQDNSMQGIGYKEILMYLNGECSKEEAVELVKLNTRHFAKRQFTYFKGMDDVIWFDKSKYENPDEEIAVEIISMVKDKFGE